MPYPGGKHGPGHYVGDGGVIPPPIVADPIGTLLVWHVNAFFSPFGVNRIYVTSDGTTIGFISAPPSTFDPGAGNLVTSEIGKLAAMSRNDPPTPPQEKNFVSLDGADWFDVSGNAASPWNIDVSPSFTQMFFFRVAGLYCIFKLNTNDYFTSPDATVWTARMGPWATPFNPAFNSYGSDGTFDYLAASFGQLWRTVDGIAWTIVEPSLSAGRFVFAGSNGVGNDRYWLFGGTIFGDARVESSLDGSIGSYSRNITAETNLDAAGLVGFNNPFSVAYSNSIGGGTFVLKFEVGGAGSSSTRVAVSSDGENWVNPGSVFNSVGPVRYSGTLGMFVATSGSLTESALLRSGNGTTWSKNVYAAFDASGDRASADLLVSF